jgi:hypothetical protein
MPQTSTERPALDSFLSQFAAPSDQQNSRPPEPTGERRELNGTHELNGTGLAGYLNGRLSDVEMVETNGRVLDDSQFVVEDVQNGALGDPTTEIADSSAATLHRGNGATYPNGSHGIESSLKGAMTEILATTASQSDSVATLVANGAVESNGVEVVEIGDAPVTPMGEIEAAPMADDEAPPDQVEQPQAGSEHRSTSLSEHPAAGSLFTPYFVTEIRELRHRCRRRSWWRRLFG